MPRCRPVRSWCERHAGWGRGERRPWQRGGCFGIALGFARVVIRRLTGLEPQAPISGQRALRPEVVPSVLPFAHGFGMETAMTIDAHRAGFRLAEVELDLEHRATGRTAGGF